MTQPRLGYTQTGGGSGSSDATKVDKYATQTKTANFNAVAGIIYLIDTTSNPVTATFPAANSAGQQIVVKWAAGTNTASIARSGSDTFGAAATSADFGLAMEVWEFTSSGTGQWNLTGGNKTLSSLDDRFSLNRVAVGEETIPRQLLKDNAVGTATSGQMRLTYFTARKTETSSQCRIITGSTAAAATPTLCRIGLFEIAANGDGTLVADTANDTSLFAAANTAYTRSWTAPFVKVAGRRYAIGPLIVSGSALPNFTGFISINGSAELQVAPKVCGFISGLSDLPANFAAAADSGSSGHSIYAVVLP